MVNHCVVWGCHFKYTTREKYEAQNISLHRFPNEKFKRDLREAWIKAVRREGWQPTKHSAVCSQHFRPEDMDYTGQTRRLRDGSVPSVFPPLPQYRFIHKLRHASGIEPKPTSEPAEQVMAMEMKEEPVWLEDNESGPEESSSNSVSLCESKEEIVVATEALPDVEKVIIKQDPGNWENRNLCSITCDTTDVKVEEPAVFKMEQVQLGLSIKEEMEEIVDIEEWQDDIGELEMMEEPSIISNNHVETIESEGANMKSTPSDRCLISHKSHSPKIILEHRRRKHESKEYICSICSTSIHSRRALIKHIRSHEQPNRCPICRKSYSKICYLNMHQKTHESAPYICSLCCKSYSLKGLFEKHIRIHEQTYKCRICQKSYSFKGHLEIHEKIHAGIQYRCTFCNKSYYSKCVYEKHVRDHEDVQYNCSLCFKSYHSKSMFKEHVRSHEGDYTCFICKKSYANKSNFKRHLKFH